MKSYPEVNHPPAVVLSHAAGLETQPGETVKLSAQGTTYPDEDELTYRWASSIRAHLSF